LSIEERRRSSQVIDGERIGACEAADIPRAVGSETVEIEVGKIEEHRRRRMTRKVAFTSGCIFRGIFCHQVNDAAQRYARQRLHIRRCGGLRLGDQQCCTSIGAQVTGVWREIAQMEQIPAQIILDSIRHQRHKRRTFSQRSQ
jgi:hypothetical protein